MYIKLDVPPSPYKTYDVDLPSTSQGIIYRVTYTIYSQEVLPATPGTLAAPQQVFLEGGGRNHVTEASL